jgi:hypothetical protein
MYIEPGNGLWTLKRHVLLKTLVGLLRFVAAESVQR